jgi:GAF domain-containing protein
VALLTDGSAVGSARVGRAPEAGVSRDQLGRLANEQAALRRVATLVARGVPAAEVFATVAEEVGRLFGADMAHIARFEADETVTIVAGWSRDGGHLPIGTRFPIDRHSLSDLVLRTGRPARNDRYTDAAGRIAASARQLGIRSSVSCPITVEGRL